MSSNPLQPLKELPLFGALSDDTLHFLLEEAKVMVRGDGETFFEQGENGESMFVILTGAVEVLRENDGQSLRLATLTDGACFGEMALIECAPRNASVVAIEETAAVEIDFARFHQLYDVAPEQFVIVHMNMAREVCRRLHLAVELLTESKAEVAELNAHGLYM